MLFVVHNFLYFFDWFIILFLLSDTYSVMQLFLVADLFILHIYINYTENRDFT